MACDTYCGLCAMVIGFSEVTDNPRSEIFRWHEGRRHLNKRERKSCAFCNSTKRYRNKINGAHELSAVDWESWEGYDRALLSEEDVAWTQTARVLGMNEQSPNFQKTFLSSSGICDEYRMFWFDDNDFENSPRQQYLSCYVRLNSDIHALYPFHAPCFELLQRVNGNTFHLDTLYEVFANLAVHGQSFRDINYGEPAPLIEQFGTSRPGYEFMATNPIEPRNCDDTILSTVRYIREKSWKPLEVTHLVSLDFCARLPAEVVQLVVSFLPSQSIFAMMQVSWSFYSFCDSTIFWVQQIRRQLPWFWELHQLLSSIRLSAIEAKQLFLWAEYHSEPWLWLDGPLMFLANRRRVWNACEQVVKSYEERTKQREHKAMAERLLAHVKISQRPLINYESFDGVDNMTAIWLHDLQDLTSEKFILQTIWEHGYLIGLAMERSGCERLVGRSSVSDHSSEKNHRIESSIIDHGDWISGFTLYTADPHVSSLNSLSHVQSLDVILTSGKILSIGSMTARPILCQRPLLATPGRTLIGIAGQVVHDHIARLGIIEGCLPISDEGDKETPQPFLSELPNLQKYLWHSVLEQEYGRKLWNVDQLNLLKLQGSTSTYNSAFPESLASRHPLLFARNKDGLKNLTRISAFVPTAEHVSMDFGEGVRDYTVERIAGMKSEQLVNNQFNTRYAGYNKLEGLVITQGDEFSPVSNESEWDDDYVVNFDINGPGGETITDVAISKRFNTIRALRLQTNHGREAVFGNPVQPNYFGNDDIEPWVPFDIPPDQTVIGLSLAFGQTGGRDPNAILDYKLYRFVSSVGVLTWRD